MIENQPEFHSLNAPGIAVLVKGEAYRPKPLFAEKLASKVRPLEPDHFAKLPISNICFQQNEQGGYDNASAFLEINGFDESLLTLLQNPQATAVSILEVNEAVAAFSGCHHLVQVGFNVGGSEIVLKRILLPGNYQPPADWPSEPLVYQGSQMPEVFVEAWDKLKVGDWDREWDERVREQLMGNSRDMNKRIVYQMINGEKWLEWNGAKMWAGLLSDRRDIGRFLAEEQALAQLKEGEFLAAKYSHGSGGAISAATAQQRKTEKPEIVGDIQMMGKNGQVYQGAVEGGAEQIDALINGLADQLRRDHNLAIPETAIPLQPWLRTVPVLPLSTYPAKFLLESQAPVGPKLTVEPRPTVTSFTENVVFAAAPIFDLTTSAYSRAPTDIEWVDFEFDFDSDDNNIAVFDWPEPDNGPDGDGGGWDSGFVWPPEPIPGGGSGVKLPVVTSSLPAGKAGSNLEVTPIDVALAAVPTKTVFVGKEKDKPDAAVSRLSSVAKPLDKEEPEKIEKTVSRSHSVTVAPSAQPAILPPVWFVELEPLGEQGIPWWQLAFTNIQVDWTMFLMARHYLILNTKLVHLSN